MILNLNNGAELLRAPGKDGDDALLWVTYPRSLAENMLVESNDDAVRLPEQDDNIRVAPTIASSSSLSEKRTHESYNKGLSPSSGSYAGPVPELYTEVLDASAVQSPRKMGFRRVMRYLQGPSKPARLTVRHYPWWPLAGAEAKWLSLTTRVRWKDPAEHPVSQRRRRSSVDFQMHDTERPAHLLPVASLIDEKDSEGDEPSYWARGVKRDLKLNRLHWALLVVTVIGWILGFAFISKALWYDSAVSSTNQNTTDLQFLACTDAFWQRNALCGMDGQSCSPFASNTSNAFRCPSGCSSTTLGAARAVGDLSVNFVPLLIGGGDEQQTYRGDSWICASAIQAGLFKDSTGGCGRVNVIGTHSEFIGKEAKGLRSLDFNSTHPLSYQFEPLEDSGSCSDDRWKGYALDVVLSAFLAFVLQPKTIVLYWILVCVGFWHVNMFSEPR